MSITEQIGLNINNDEIVIDLTGENARWEELVNKIMAGDVIPVIGPDFQLKGEVDVDKHLIGWLSKYFKLENTPKTYSQLIYDPNVRRYKDNIYNIIDQVLNQMKLTPSDLIVRLLKTKKFPFVITTSFTPVVENIMRNEWGEVQVLQFRNDASRDMKAGEGDITSERDLQKPTIFYMFGKHSYEKERYAVTEADFMVFCKSWLAEQNVPKVLATAIKKRSLLCLGSSYSDWLLRFIWYSMRTKVEDLRSSVVVSHHVEPTLEEFLKRVEASIQRDPKGAIDQIVDRINARHSQIINRYNDAPRFEHDIFISYSRTDEFVVGRLRDSLKEQGLNVWFDRTNINGGDGWLERITHGIRTSRLFVPILSKNIEREIYEEHEYRTEWRIATAIFNKRGGQTFIYPLNEKGFDFYKPETKVPSEFQEKHAIAYDITSDFIDIAKAMATKVEELRKLENELQNGNNN